MSAITTPQPVVVVTRDERGGAAFSEMLTALGARPVPLQTIAVEPVTDTAPLAAALAQLERTDWVLFTSAHAVDTVCDHAAWQLTWRRRPGRARIAAVGEATAARLVSRGIEVDLKPRDASAAGLVDALRERTGDLGGVRVIWPRSNIARRELPDALRAAGAVLTDPPAYRTVAVRPRQMATFLRGLEAGAIDVVAFLSPSSVHGLAAAMPGGTLAALQGRALVASIGPTTTAALTALGLRADVQPDERTARALADAIVKAVRARRPANV